MDKKLNQEENYTPTKDDFKFTQDKEKIYDVKMETKTTTFAKDAFKRFCKNKSSVVGAIIIGFIILLSIIVPMVSPYNVDDPEPNLALLPPKLVEAGSGVWDGTREYKNVPYNVETGVFGDINKDTGLPVYNQSAIIKYDIKHGEKVTIDNASQVSYDGTTVGGAYLTIVNEVTGDPRSQAKLFNQYNVFKIPSDGDYMLSIKFRDLDELDFHNSRSTKAEYRVILEKGPEGKGKQQVAILRDWSKDYSDLSVNLSNVLKENNIASIDNANISIQIAGQNNVRSHFMLESLIISSESADEKTKAYLEDISIVNPSTTFFKRRADSGKYPVGYYRISADTTAIYEANISLADILYDEYAGKLGNIKGFKFGKSDLDVYIANKWCEYDYTVGPSSFKVLDPEKCPIISIDTQTQGEGNFKDVITFTGEVTWYKYKGFSSMPKFILGANANGFDLVKLSFVALRTSLLLAIVSSAICLAIGLCWGSISGYFGGNVDLFMERITDILANVPFIVVMTLTILILGNNIFTFALALCLTSWIGVAARTRTQFYRFKGREYILASRTLGASDGRLIFKHILPNALGTIVTSSVLMIPSVIFSEASISYLGLGLQGSKSFGVILSENQQYINSLPALIVFPAVIISLLMISFNLFGNGLRDALNPSLKGSE